QLATSRFRPSLAWLSPAFTGTKLNARVGGRSPNGTPAPGTHGHGIDSVSIGGVTLQPSPAVNRIPAGSNPTVDVKFTNQGENNEIDVRVLVGITGAGKPITATKTPTQHTARKRDA